MGLSGMRERAMLLNGSFEIEFAPNDGTTIFVRIPINSDTAKPGNDDE
jgi:two-component system sensor histidine kinase NreB